jgi:hypothetical protein
MVNLESLLDHRVKTAESAAQINFASLQASMSHLSNVSNINQASQTQLELAGKAAYQAAANEALRYVGLKVDGDGDSPNKDIAARSYLAKFMDMTMDDVERAFTNPMKVDEFSKKISNKLAEHGADLRAAKINPEDVESLSNELAGRINADYGITLNLDMIDNVITLRKMFGLYDGVTSGAIRDPEFRAIINPYTTRN